MATNLGTRIYTALYGKLVGRDEESNRYYIERRDPGRARRRRRWVIYKGAKEASRVPPEWHRWLHYTGAEAPSDKPLTHRAWEKEHVPNRTGTPEAYHPPGHDYEGGRRAPATGDYEPWRPA